MTPSETIDEFQNRLKNEGDPILAIEAELNVTRNSINPQWYINRALKELEAVDQVFSGIPARDYVKEYGVLIKGSRIRHFIDKSTGSTATLCELLGEFVKGESIDADLTCEKCADRQVELRSK